MRKKALFLLSALLCCWCMSSPAQNFKYNISVEQITFSGAGYITIKYDSTASTTAITGPHWRSDGTRKQVAFVSGSSMGVTAGFKFTCTKAAPDSVLIRASGDDTLDLPAVTVPLTSAGSGVYTLTYPFSTATKIFPAGVVGYYAPFHLAWQISFDKGATWTAVDTTRHTVYVTKYTPMPETSQFKYFQTVLDMSCRNAKGETTDTGIISHCWQEFLDHVTLNYKGDSLCYYKTLNTSNTSLPLLLRNRNAQCYTFAQLFLALIKIQGISRTGNYVFIEPAYPTYSCGQVNRFLVKNWKFNTKSDSVACPSFPYKNTYMPGFSSTGVYVWSSADVTDLDGAPGQCSNNPASFFNNHQIVKLGGKYYDACYGLTFNSLADVKTAAFDGWVISNLAVTPYTANITNDLSKADLQETITTW